MNRRDRFRFDPPVQSLGAFGWRWALVRAFGPAGEALPTGVDPDPAAIPQLGLGGLIAIRQPLALLQDELGWEQAHSLLVEAAAIAAITRGQIAACERVLEIAARSDIPVVLLKGLAIHVEGLVAPGARSMIDLDLLIPSAAAPTLVAALAGHGFRTQGSAWSNHQLPTIFNPEGHALELHRRLPGVRVAGTEDAFGFDSLHTREHLLRLTDLPGESYVIRRQPAIAYTLAHWLYHHGFTPGLYPPFRALGDLAALGFDRESVDDLTALHGWIRHAVPGEELTAAHQLCRALVAGGEERAAAFRLEGLAGRLLEHLLAASFSEDYRRKLALLAVASSWLHRRQVKPLMRTVARAFFPSAEAIDKIYGPQKSGWARLGRRLWRPFDLVGRTARSLAASLRLRRSARPRGSN